MVLAWGLAYAIRHEGGTFAPQGSASRRSLAVPRQSLGRRLVRAAELLADTESEERQPGRGAGGGALAAHR